jgi:glycerol-3-phosphate dehydrogenase (NAD(P)+)
MRIAVLGGGSWGTCLARVFVDRGHVVVLWARNPETAASVRAERQNVRHLPGVLLPLQISVSGSLDAALRSAEVVVLAVPCPTLRVVLGELRLRLAEGVPVLIGTRGLDSAGPATPSEVAREMLPQTRPELLATLGGPALAADLARGNPTVGVLAGPAGGNRTLLQQALEAPGFPVVTTDDVLGVEVAGALRGVVALGAGMCEGLDLGEGARALLLARGHEEINALALALGAHPDTLAGPAGLADLAVACGSPRCRDWQVGYLVGRGMALAQVRSERHYAASEVVETARAALTMARVRQVHLPVIEALGRALSGGRSARDALLEVLFPRLRSGSAAGSQPDAFEMDEIDERPEALADGPEVQGAEAIQAEVLHGVGGQHRPENHRVADVHRARPAGVREPAHEPTGERVPGAGRVDDGLDREGGGGEHPAFMEKQGSGVAPLDHDGPGPERADRARRRGKVRDPR